MNTSEQIDQIATALAKAQGEITNPAKDSENPHFRSRYADLASGLNAVRPILAKCGLSAIQMTRMDGDLMMLDTRLLHASGQWIESAYPVCRFPAKQQEVGSALTYSRRYSLFAMVGIAGEDDDGNEASKSETPAPPARSTDQKAAAPKQSPMLSPIASETAANTMMATLDLCGSLDSLKKWATGNKPTKDRLVPNDQGLVSKAYEMKLEDLRSEDADPFQEAAE